MGIRTGTPAESFKGPPEYPNLYPGQRPSGSYLLSHDERGMPTVFSLYNPEIKNLGRSTLNADGGLVNLNEFLKSRGRSSVEDRVVVLAYGSNANPMQLVRKFGVIQNGILSDIDTVVLKGRMNRHSVVYLSRVSAYGAIPASIIPSDGWTEAWITLIDKEQLLRMHETEGVKADGSGTYRVRMQEFKDENGSVLQVYGYVGGSAKVYSVPSPIKFAGRKYAGLSGSIVPDVDFVPIEGDASLPERAHIEMMDLYRLLTMENLKIKLFEDGGPAGAKSYQLTPTAKSRLKEVNEQLSLFGSSFPAVAEYVTEPFNTSSFKTLKDII